MSAPSSPLQRQWRRQHPAMQRQQSESALMKRPGSMPLLAEAETAPPNHCCRLVILGSSCVGKTAIVSRFLENHFVDKYQPTIEDFHRKVYRIRGEAYRLDILDTSGNNPFPAMRRLSLVTGDIFLLVYSIDSQESFEEVKRIKQQIIETKGSKSTNTGGATLGGGKKRHVVPMVVVGNKCELDNERVVGTDELRALGSGAGIDWVEVSAKSNINIDEIFVKLFYLAKLPSEMSPSLHRKVNPGYVGHSPGSVRRGMTLRKRGPDDALGAVAPNVRRPSIRTDLLMMQTKYHSFDCHDTAADISKDGKCVVQ